MPSDATLKRLGNRRGFGSQLRAEIIAAAERLLATSGSRDGVTLRAIAREAGVAAPSIYAHFSDRDEILDAVIARTFTALAETCQRAAATAPRGADTVTAISLAYLAFARNSPGQYRTLFERSPADIASPPHQYPEGIKAFGLLLSAFEDIAAVAPSRDLDPTLEAQSLFVALHGIATLPAALPGFPWLEETVLVDDVIAKSTGRAPKMMPVDDEPSGRRMQPIPQRGSAPSVVNRGWMEVADANPAALAATDTRTSAHRTDEFSTHLPRPSCALVAPAERCGVPDRPTLRE